MKLHLIPAVLALMLPGLAYYFYIAPTSTVVSALDARVALASTEADTIAAGTMIRPRIERERAQIATRLVRVKPYTVPQAETRFLADIARLARTDGVRVVSVTAKGKPAPFGAAARPAAGSLPVPPTPLPAANASTSTMSMRSLADGVLLDRSVTVAGSLDAIVHFVDHLGAIATPIAVGNITLSEGDELHATFDCNVVVIDPTEVRAAKRVTVRASPLTPKGRLM